MKRKRSRLSFGNLFHGAMLFLLSILTTNKTYGQHLKDTVHFQKATAGKHRLVLSDSALNAIGIDSLLNKIENVHTRLSYINNTTSIGFDTRDIKNDFPEIDSSIDIIDENVSLYNKVLDVKNLQMFTVLLQDMQAQLNDWRNSLFKYNRDLLSMKAEITGFTKDTILAALMTDTVFHNLYKRELNDLNDDIVQAQKSTDTSLAGINQLQSELSNEYFETLELQSNVRDLLRKASIKSKGKEYDYLWNVKSSSLKESQQIKDLSEKSYQGQQRILSYYFKLNWDDQLWMLLTGLVFMLWVFRNFKQVEKYEGQPGKTFSPKFIKKIAILPTLVVLFNLAPLFDIHPPTAYVEIMEFLLAAALTLLLWRRWPKELFFYWLLIGALYIVFSFTGAFLTPALSSRLLLLLLNIISVAFGLYWIRIINRYMLTLSRMIRLVSILYIILNAAGIFCNLFGRLSLAKIFSVTAIFGLTQIIALSIFIEIMLEAFQLQTTVNQLKGGMAARLNYDKIQRLLTRALKLLSIGIWIIVFTISLNIYNLIFSQLTNFLTTPRKIGSTSFEIGNILLFVTIIYISNILQKGIGSLYGTTDDTWDPEVRKNGSRLAMTRLLLIIIGFLLAVAASGLPIDKITIVLGALGVGIGLGLQSIVNNLVSGVILIFEQPFRIGDYIELGDKRGRVLDIGIRSSKLVMEEGAEIIMPNGDLLSGRVINWTLRNDHVRLELPIAIEQGRPFEDVQQIIREVLRNSEYVLKTGHSEILLTAITDKLMNLTILVWINDVHRVQAIKSELLDAIHSSLAKHEIKMV